MPNGKLVTEYLKNLGAPSKERKHIILFDGTWNDETGLAADGNVTNIVHLNRILKRDPEKQIVTYHRGVGNDNDNGRVNSILKGATGKEIRKIVDVAYAKFVKNWQKGDKIYIFGFSRGAASARLLAYKIWEEGIPHKITITVKPTVNHETNVVEQAVDSYTVDSSKRTNTDIEFLGVWDTVAALGAGNNFAKFFGLYKKNIFQDNHIAGNIQKAVHLVAIDETRSIFSVALMNHKPGVTHEVWFPGVHSDVGGGYANDEIARVTLYYMLKCWEELDELRNGAPVIVNEAPRTVHSSEKVKRASFHFHGGGLGKDIREIGVQEDGEIKGNVKPKIHKMLTDITEDNAAIAVFKINKGSENEEVRTAHFNYRPFQIELIRKSGFEIVS